LADWNSAGRWGIEIMTAKNSYRLIPLEKLSFCPIGSVHWQNIEIKAAYREAKEGICEELAVMSDQSLETQFPLVSLNSAKDLTRLGEQIFGYPPAP